MGRATIMKKYVFLPFAPIWWGYQMAIKATVAALGLVVVPFMYRWRKYENIPSVFRPWQNPEDWRGGVAGNEDSLPYWWKTREGKGFWSFYKYHAIRNPADGLRNYKWLNLKINPDKVYYVTDQLRKHYEPWAADASKLQWYICWQNVWLGVKVQWIRKKTYTEFKLGTRVEPWDSVEGPDPKGSRAKHGASFASKFILNRRWKD